MSVGTIPGGKMQVQMGDLKFGQRVKKKLEACALKDDDLILLDLSAGIQDLRRRIALGERVILVVTFTTPEVVATFKALGVYEVYERSELERLLGLE